MPIAERDEWDDNFDGPRSTLDRTIDLPIATGRWMVVALAFAAGVLLRFLDLTRWPLSVGEAEITLTAHNLVHGADVPESLLGMPTTIQWVALFLFSGGSTESLARVAVATAGLLAVLAATRFERWLGAIPAVAASVLLATSPTLVAASRRVDGGILLVLLSLALIACLLRAFEERGLLWPALAGVSVALLLLSHPLGLPAILLCGLAVYLLERPEGEFSRDPVLIGFASALGTLALVATVFFTHPASFTASIGENLSLLWNDYVTEAGEGFYMPAFNLILNEPLLLILAVVAAKASPHRTLVRATGIWAIETFILISILGDVVLPGYAITVLPLALLAGLGAAHLVERVPWHEFRRGPAAIFVVAVILASAALMAVFGMVTGGAGADRSQWLLEFGLVIAVGVLPLAWTISWLGQRLAGDRGVLVLLAALILIGAISVRSTVLAASERPGMPGEPTAAGAIGSDVPILVGRLDRLSRDLTNSVRDSQDPGGGHGLIIAVDSAISQPFEWYFREYPNLTVFDPETELPPADAQVVLLSETRDPRAVAPAYRGQNYLYAHDTPEFYQSPDWGALVSGIFSPSDWRTFAGFVLDREFATDPAAIEFQLLATPDIAAQLFPSVGPFSLDDRPGAGSGDGQLSRPRGIIVADDGSTYVVDSRNVRVQQYDASGQYVAQFGGEGSGPGQFARFPGAGGGGPGGIAIGDDGRIYVADTWNHRVQVFSPEGAFLFSWGSFFDAQDDPNASQASPGQFYGPRDIAVHDGMIYVTDTGNERVQVFTPEGEFVRMFGLPGSSDGQLLEPVGIHVTDDGTVLVADSHNARIARFTTAGEWLDPWPVVEWTGQRFFEPYLEVGQDGTVYASTSTLATIIVLDSDGTPQPALLAPELRQPFGLALTPDGSQLLVTDSTINAVVRVPLTP
jgi:DNA-binding beta-propeller fold protein YncE